MKKICVIDYDSGNIKSVYNALRMILVGTKNSIVVSSKKEKIKENRKIKGNLKLEKKDDKFKRRNENKGK